MNWLVRDASPDDSLFFHCQCISCGIWGWLYSHYIYSDSGHGGQTKDLDGDEEDGYDEVIYPMDFEEAGHLTDDVRVFNAKSNKVTCANSPIGYACPPGQATSRWMSFDIYIRCNSTILVYQHKLPTH